MYKTWRCVTLCYSLKRYPPANENRISTSSKLFNMEVYERSTWFHFEMIQYGSLLQVYMVSF